MTKEQEHAVYTSNFMQWLAVTDTHSAPIPENQVARQHAIDLAIHTADQICPYCKQYPWDYKNP